MSTTVSEDGKTITVNLGLVGTCVYLAIGILYHLITGDGPFEWSDPWLYVTMAIWPIFLLGWLIALILAAVALWVGYYYFFEDLPKKRRRKADVRRNREEFEERRRTAAKATPPADD
jgi:hypothetical protein